MKIVSINDAKVARRQLELNIRTAVQVEVARFEEATGLTPNSISIEMARFDLVGVPESRYVVDHVRADIKI